MIEFRPAGGSPLRDKISAAIPMIKFPGMVPNRRHTQFGCFCSSPACFL